MATEAKARRTRQEHVNERLLRGERNPNDNDDDDGGVKNASN